MHAIGAASASRRLQQQDDGSSSQWTGPVYLLTARTKFGVGGGGLLSGCHVTKAVGSRPARSRPKLSAAAGRDPRALAVRKQVLPADYFARTSPS